MNEKEIEWANGLYELQEEFNKLAEKIFEENKPFIKVHLERLWKYLDDGGVTNEALRCGVRQEALRSLGAVLEYDSSIYADQLRDSCGSTPTAKTEVRG